MNLNMNEEIDIIWRKFQKELSAFVISKVGNKQDADDILQNAFIKIINKQEQVFAANDIRQYIYKIVRNATMDHFRSNTAKQVLNLSHSGAKSRVQRGRDKLKKIILDCCNLESDAYGNLSSDDLNSNCDC